MITNEILLRGDKRPLMCFARYDLIGLGYHQVIYFMSHKRRDKYLNLAHKTISHAYTTAPPLDAETPYYTWNSE